MSAVALGATSLLASACMSKSDGKIFIRVDDELKQAWLRACEARGVSQQVAGTRLVEWIVAQPEHIQAAIFSKVGVIRCDIFNIPPLPTKLDAARAAAGSRVTTAQRLKDAERNQPALPKGRQG